VGDGVRVAVGGVPLIVGVGVNEGVAVGGVPLIVGVGVCGVPLTVGARVAVGKGVAPVAVGAMVWLGIEVNGGGVAIKASFRRAIAVKGLRE
jgi:hypothetical protein